MRHRTALFRAGLAFAAGLLLAATAAGPASAEHPEPAPQPFEAGDLGEDGCTVFETAGEARWAATHPPEDYRVDLLGSAHALQTPGAPEVCLPVVPADRHVEFTAFVGDEPVDEHLVPIGYDPEEYQFSFTASAAIDHITVAVCQERRSDGSTWSGRCGHEVTIDGPGAQPEPPYCRYSYQVSSGWENGYVAQIGITALVEPLTSWMVVADLGTAPQAMSVWNASSTLNGSRLQLTDPGWNTTVQVGQTVHVGFFYYGPAEPPPTIEVYGNGRPCESSVSVS